VTRLLLSLLRLLAANWPAGQGAIRGRGAGQYRRLVPAAAEAGYGPVGGYRQPSRRDYQVPAGYPNGAGQADGTRGHEDFRHEDGFDEADGYRDSDSYADADLAGDADGYWLADGLGHGVRLVSGDTYDSGHGDGYSEGRGPLDGLAPTGSSNYDDAETETAANLGWRVAQDAPGLVRSGAAGHGYSAGSSRYGAPGPAGAPPDGFRQAGSASGTREAGFDSAGRPTDLSGRAGRPASAGSRRPGVDGAPYASDSVRLRAAGRGSEAASVGGRPGGAGSSGAGGRSRGGAGGSAAGAGGYQRRGTGTDGTRAGARSGASGSGGGRSRSGGRPAGRAGVLPPGEPYATEPFMTEPMPAGPRPGDGFPGGPPLTGTVHRPERGGRGPGPGWGGGSGWGTGGGRRPRRRWIPLRYKWIAALVVLGLIFRRAVAWAVLFALSAALHLVGVGIHLPSVKFGWPWQSVTSNSTTTTPVGPWVLQKIEGISKPALGRVNFNFVFTRKVSKSIGPWPCWYQSTFAATGHASATVALNPGSAWWAPGTGHYKLRVLSAPQGGKPGHLSVRMMLPMPQLPQSAHDVTIDDLPSKPIDVQHSWTYPGFGCGTLLKPQFDNSVLYAQAQQIAFYKSTHVAQVTKPLMAAAEAEAVQTVRDNFVQPTVNALGYTLDRFTIAWVSR